MAEESASNRVAKNMIFLYARMGITVFINLYSTRLILKALGNEDYGIFGIVGGSIAMLAFLNNALSSATQRFMSFSHGSADYERQKSIFNVSVILHLIIAVVVTIILESAFYFVFNGMLNFPGDRIGAAKIVYHVVVVNVIFSITTVPYNAIIVAHENMLFYAIMNIVTSLLNFFIALYLVNVTFDRLIIYSVLVTAVSFVNRFCVQWYCKKKYKESVFDPKKYFKRVLMIEMTKFAGWNLLNTISTMLYNNVVSIVLNNFFGVIVNAAQGVVNQINSQVKTLSDVMMNALNPVITKKAGAGEVNGVYKALVLGSKLSFMLKSLLALPLIIEADYIFHLWLVSVPQWSIEFFKYMVITELLFSFSSLLNSSLSAQGKIGGFTIFRQINVWFFFGVVVLALYMGGSPLIVYQIKIISTITGTGILMYFNYKHFSFSVISYLNRVILPCISTALIAFAVCYFTTFLFAPGMLRLLVVITLSTVINVLATYFIALANNEKVLVNSIIINYKNKLAIRNENTDSSL